jgi:hypothetical protein
MELRVRPKARTTRDVDLTMGTVVEPGHLRECLEEVHEELQTAASGDLGDFFEFVIEPARWEIKVARGAAAYSR